MSDDMTFETIKETVSSWYDKNGCIPMLRVLFRDHVNPPELKDITLTMKILDQLITGGHLSSKDLSIICDTIIVTKHFGLLSRLQEIMPSFPDVRKRTITHFRRHRQNLMAFGMVLNGNNVIKIDGMYNQPLTNYPNAWQMITDLEDRKKIQEGHMESFEKTLRTLSLHLALEKLTEGNLGTTSNTNPEFVPVPVYVPTAPALRPEPPTGSILEEYKMTSSPCGICLIINNMHFDDKGTEDLEGYKFDEVRLTDVFEDHFDFCVSSFCDQTAEQIKAIVQHCSKEDHGKYDCFVCCVLSHGGRSKDGQDFILGTDGEKVMKSEITGPFQSTNCKTLEHKPKVFFFQACRGGNFPEFVTATVTGVTIPADSHFLMANSTVRGNVSVVTEHGSPFIQTLTKTLKNEPERDIHEILALVNKMVSSSPTMATVKDEAGNKRIVPAVLTPSPEYTLQGKLIFRRKFNPKK